MRLARTFIVLLTLVLLLSSAPATGLRSTQAAGLQMGMAPTVEPLHRLNGTDASEQPPFGAPGALSVASVIQPSAGNWHIETVDSNGVDTSLVLDESGYPHISYFAAWYPTDLKYAWHSGTSWQIETVDSEGDVGLYTSLALDGLGRPHISYYDETKGDLKYAWHDDTGWQIETVDSGGDVGAYTSLALDSSDRPCISYYDRTNGDLKCAWRNGAGWHIDIVDEGESVGQYTSLALDGSGRPHISYFDCYPNYDLKYAWYDGAAWNAEVVDSENALLTCTSLALGGSGQPHISYHDETNDILKYAWRDEMGWHIETVDIEMWVDAYASLALDELDWPHISYYKAGASPALKYAWHDGAGWRFETVDNSEGYSRDISLALDGSRRPHISYHVGYPNHELRYAYLMPLPLISIDKRATPSDGLRKNDTLTYTLTISAPGLSVQLWDPLPASVQYVSDSIAGSVTPAATYNATAHAVEWAGTLPTDTLQTVRFQVTPGITGTEAFSLSQPIVNTAWLTDTANSRNVSATVIVNGWHVYLPLVMRE